MERLQLQPVKAEAQTRARRAAEAVVRNWRGGSRDA
jgi:hypothetical protein